MQRDPSGDPSARHSLIDLVADLRLQNLQFPRQVHGNLALFAIHRTELDRDLEAIPGMFAPSVSSHRSHRRPNMQKALGIVDYRTEVLYGTAERLVIFLKRLHFIPPLLQRS